MDRPLKADEASLLKKLLEKDFPGRDQLLDQLQDVLVTELDDEGSLSLKVGASVPAPVNCRVPVEARYADMDSDPEAGPHVHVLLHVVDGRMAELEIYKDDSSPIKKRPAAKDLEVFTN